MYVLKQETTILRVIFVGINFRGKTFRNVFVDSFLRNSSLLQACMHACGTKFVGINVRGTRLISENHEHLYPLYGIHRPVSINCDHSHTQLGLLEY